MNLVYDWKRLIKKAWSFRLMGAAFVLEGFESLLPLFVDDVPRHLFTALSLLALAFGMWSRLVAQPKMYEQEHR